MEKLQNKNILFFSVSFFNYEKIIADRLRDFGAVVDFYDERPSNSIMAKGIIRLKRSAYQVQINKYYKKIILEIQNKKYAYLLLIKGEVMPAFFIKEVKRINPEIELIYYNFDSFSNNPNAKEILPFFDKKFTFDKKDAIDYKIDFRPLFYSKEYELIRDQKLELKYHAMFIGTAHTDRYIISESVKNWCENNGLKAFTFYYSPNKFVFLYKKNFDNTFKEFDIKKITFNSLRHDEIINLYRESKAVLDINHPAQTGLTMRTFEALGAGRKLITTNAEIKKYPFYNLNNILVIDRNNIQLSKHFFESEFEPITQNTLQKMSLDGWIECLFVAEQNKYWFNS